MLTWPPKKLIWPQQQQTSSFSPPSLHLLIRKAMFGHISAASTLSILAVLRVTFDYVASLCHPTEASISPTSTSDFGVRPLLPDAGPPHTPEHATAVANCSRDVPADYLPADPYPESMVFYTKAISAIGGYTHESDDVVPCSIPCAYASTEAKADATAQRTEINNTKKRVHPEAPEQAAPSAPAAKKRQAAQSTLTAMSFCRNDMPYGEAEADAFQKQALPDRVDAVLFVRLKGRLVGLSTDGWKCKKKNAVNAICANVDFQPKSYLLELIDVTELNKDGPSLCEQFAAMIDRVEVVHGCIIIYFTMDADGGSNKGRKLLGKLRPWLILPSCWAHQLILGDYFKVNDMAAIIAEDATGLIAWINNHQNELKAWRAVLLKLLEYFNQDSFPCSRTLESW
ncbi:hypothetical protein B0H10DRAFT_2310760 [Mycena sp. CBHHK59/15]|nr:hypothetical protein B0H10DRAFT_2310760 [Mycena sp. CBHHK59/15]